MSYEKSRRFASVLLVFGAVVFGVVLTAGLDWTPLAYSSSVLEQAESAVTVDPSAATAGFANLAEAVAPAVVSIRTITFEESRGPQGGTQDPFEFFFGPRNRPNAPQAPGQPQVPEEFRSEAGGSGFVISADGLIVTNNHVVEGASELMVNFGGDREFPATVRGTDPDTDLALIQIEGQVDLPHLKLGAMEKVRVGDWVMVIGNPLRLGRTVTVGVVSATGRTLGITDVSFENFIQTDAAINFGNSGGPMVNMQGEVVGIATAVNWGAENIGFAVPVSTLRQVLPQLETEGRVSRGYLGVTIQNLDFRIQQAFGLDSSAGALVQNVNEGTPAADADIDHGDIILQVDDRKVETTRDLIDYVASKRPGTKVELEILRNGKTIHSMVTLRERPSAGETAPAPSVVEPAGVEWLGLKYQELTPGLKASHGIPDTIQGVWIQTIEPRSPLAEEQIRPGDVVTEVNGTPVDGAESFEAEVDSIASDSFVRLYVERFDPRSGRSVQFFAFARKP
jgi:serine protease Do